MTKLPTQPEGDQPLSTRPEQAIRHEVTVSQDINRESATQASSGIWEVIGLTQNSDTASPTSARVTGTGRCESGKWSSPVPTNPYGVKPSLQWLRGRNLVARGL
jgi:hypothetical protein